ncbi:unnamed protein product [Schistosoma mattheei]|uniref:Uncharacterized protein n=1 Tax=Schistosoma mattheei TaxID=31246 RepID=A0A183Q8D3_9TREM|nr:unnamed protein product [Schistosoma mattheei]
MIRFSRITKMFSETVFIQKTSSVPSITRKLSTNICLSAPSDCALPEPPLPPNKEVILNTLGEPTFSSLGLNSYWPSGWYQCLLETLHVHLDLPWWGAIAASQTSVHKSLVGLNFNGDIHVTLFYLFSSNCFNSYMCVSCHGASTTSFG